MNRLIGMAAGTVALVLAAAACGSSTSPTSPTSSTPPSSSTGSPGASSAAAVTLGTSSVGPILLDGRGRTLYLFAADTGTTSTCVGACAGAWPPDTTTGPPQAGSGVNGSLVGTTRRADGTTEVTYHGHPLYYYAGDAKSGDVNGQGVTAFGAKWYVVNATGDPVTAAASPTSGGGYGGY